MPGLLSLNGWGGQLLLGALVTVALALPAFVLGCLLGTGAAAVREKGRGIGPRLVFAYTTLVRGIPELVLIYLIFFGGAQFLDSVARMFGAAGGYHPGPYLAGLVSLSLICGAYATEVMRGAFKALDRGQMEAARAFGWSRFGAFRRIVFPQLLRIALPGLGNVWLLTLKDTSLVSVTGLTEIMRAATVATGSTDLPLYFYGVAMALYLLLSSASHFVFRSLERQSRRGLRGVVAP